MFYTVAQENCFFINILKLKTFLQVPVKFGDSLGIEIKEDQPLGEACRTVVKAIT